MITIFWNREIETMERDEMKALQLKRLKETIERVYHTVPFYKEKLDSVKMTPEKFTALKDLEEIPFTVKDDLRTTYPNGLFSEPMENIVRLHGSSGTTGKPIIVGYTRDDMDMWSECIARLATMAGASKKDIVQIAFGYGLFTGGFGLHQGLEKIGATVIPMSSGNTEKQLMMMQDFKTSLLVCTPSYAIHIGEVAKEMGLKKEDLNLKIGMFGGEGQTAEMSKKIEDDLGILVTENYGLCEIIGPGVSGNCTEKDGMHINEDHFLAEIINSQTGQVINPADKGEIVFTTLSKQGMPLLRYRTRDITYLIEEPCKCGRTLRRMAKIQGRSDDMLIIKGINVFPSQVESVIMGIEHLGPHYQLVVSKKGYTDALEVQVELVDGSLLNNYRALEELKTKIKQKIRVVLSIDVKITLVNPKTFERTAGKSKRVIDLR